MSEMRVEYLPIEEVKEYERNAKKHPEEQVEYIANSIKKFGFQQPIVVAKDNTVIIGHGRLLAAKKLGLAEVPVVRATGLSDSQIKALRIADNKIAERGTWDNVLLGDEIKLIIDDIDMTDFGFGDFEITMLTEDFEPEPFDDKDIEEYTSRGEVGLASNRVIITYRDEDAEYVAKMLGLEEITKVVYDVYRTDGKYILDGDKLVICQSNARTDLLQRVYPLAIVNPLGDWTGGLNVDTGATNRKLGSDMGDSVTGGGLHGKDLSKADVSVNIYAYLRAEETGKEVEYSCAIGDTEINGIPYQEVVETARQYIRAVGGFERFAEWGLIR